MTTNMATLLTLQAVFGADQGRQQTIHADVIEMTKDRYGHVMVIKLYTGEIISGRLSKKHRFTGKRFFNGSSKVLKSVYNRRAS